LGNAAKQKWKLSACENRKKREDHPKRTSHIIKKIDVHNPMTPGVMLQSVDRPTAIAHASIPITAMNATMRALVLTWPCLILSQIPPQKLEQQPGSDIDAGLLVAEYLHLLLNRVFCVHPLHHLPVSHCHRRAATPVQRILSPSAAAPPLTVTADCTCLS
jgi:hypothetical protein